MAKADLHVHSKHSNQPAEWYLRQLGAPECFTEPLEIYRRCRARGLDFVTISDHDTIAAPLALSVAPYLVAVHQLHKDEDLLDAAALRFSGSRPEREGAGGRAWLTDSLAEADGIARILRGLPGPGQGRGLAALTCARGGDAPAALAVREFRPQMEIPLPGAGPRRRLALPPLLEVLDHCEKERYAEIVITTPGPFGLLGVAAGRLLGIPVTAFWCTDLPATARRLAGGPAVEELAWVYLRWLFGQAAKIFVPGTEDWELLAERGFSPARLELLARRPAPGPIEGIHAAEAVATV